MTKGRVALIVGGLVMGGGALAFILWQPPHSDVAAAAERAVKARLTDPYSAQFSMLRVVDATQGARVVCGWVNAKNSMGGYVGDRPFVYQEFDNGVIVLSAKHQLELPNIAALFQPCGIRP